MASKPKTIRETVRVDVELVHIPDRLRPLNEAAVGRLAQSMREIGLRQPITVRYVEEMEIDGEVTIGVYILVAGHHRVEAARRLGWEYIDGFEVDDDELHAELWEIDENLIRAELSPAQQASHLARRKEIWEALQESGSDGATLTGRGNRGFATETAGASGISKGQINKQIARSDALGDDINRISGTSLDKPGEMDRLAKMAPEERAPIIEKAQAGLVVSARPLVDADAVEKQVDRLMKAWNAAGPEARGRFREVID